MLEKIQLQRSHYVMFAVIILLVNVAITFLLAHNRVVLNYDGILYLTLADLIQQGSLDHPMLDHRGFIYSYSIQFLASITSLDLQAAAYLLNSLFITLMTFAFIVIIVELGGSSRTVLLLSVVLVVLFPSMSKYKSMVIRDFAYLSCYLWSIVFLLKYFRTERMVFLCAWFCVLVIGGFFRIESLLFLVLIGLGVIFVTLKKSSFRFLSIKSVLLVSVIVIGLLIVLESNISNYYVDYFIDYLNKSFQRLFNKAEFVGFTGGVAFVFMMFADVFYEVARRLDFVYLIIAVIACVSGLVLNKTYQRNVFLVYVVLGITILALFNAKEGFISSRYTLSIALTVLALCPFLLEQMVLNWSSISKLKKFSFCVVALVLVCLSFKEFEYSDRYLERAAGEWLINNMSANEQAVISNNSKILYYADEFPYVKRGSHYYRYSTSYLMDKYKGKFSDHDYLALFVDVKSVVDVEKNDFFRQRFGDPINTIQSPKKPGSKYVNVYKLK